MKEDKNFLKVLQHIELFMELERKNTYCASSKIFVLFIIYSFIKGMLIEHILKR